MRDLLDAILLLGNTLTIHKITTRLCYLMLGLVNIDPDMSYDTQDRLIKTCMHFIVPKRAQIMEKQNMHVFWRIKMCTLYGEKNKFWCMARKMNKNNTLHHHEL